MYLLAYILLLIGFLCALGGAAWSVLTLYGGRDEHDAERAVRIPEWANIIQFCCVLFASAILLRALVTYDFSLVYVASYTDRLLPLFYRLTAFWAGQAGSLLFWAGCVVACGVAFQLMPIYARFSAATRLWYWLFFLLITSFFGLLLICWTNPFELYTQAPADGNGLNPLLQHPGMIFHPPLLFLGYGGFVVPGCLALAQAASGALTLTNKLTDPTWASASRPITLISWLCLTAGIVLGGWWSYMELGWGGYWAWDPVENASLIPWLISTAALHALIIHSQRDKLARTSIFLMALTSVSAFFATYLVRSGVVQSLHAFGDNGVGQPLLIFVLLATLTSLWGACLAPKGKGGALEGLHSREGLLIVVIWLLLLLSCIILIATLWPVFSLWFSNKSVGLDVPFYNRVCMPLFALLIAVLAVCPWMGWNGAVRDIRRLGTVIGSGVASAGAFWAIGYTHPVAVCGMGAAVAALVSLSLQLGEPAVRRHRPSLAAWGVHLGLACMALGIAFSGPYKLEREVVLAQGQNVTVGPFTVTLTNVKTGATPAYEFIGAELAVTNRGKEAGTVMPERRLYTKWSRQAFAEADVVPSLGSEFYASLLAVDPEGRATLRLSSNPLVNWMWIGGTLMCLFPLIALGGSTRRKRDTEALD